LTDAISYLNSLGLHKVNPGLERIIRLLSALGNPHNKMPSIIIGGTNGKGSVSAMVASVLKSEGYKTGLYTSPHLIRVSERIRINDEEIPIDDLYRLILEIKNLSSRLLQEPSYFEVLTACAFLYFSEKKVDFMVLEVGMGGRWDATNVVTPLVSVITNVSRDHTEFLGETIGQIAFEKAGIIKQGMPVVTAANGEALDVIESIAYKRSAPLSVMGRDFRTQGEGTEDFRYSGVIWNLDHLRCALPGFYQVENASVAICALESLSRSYAVEIKERNLRDGLLSVRWEGRMEFLRDDPPLILDGAHNPGGARALRESIQKMFPGRKFLFLIGMLGDKDHRQYIEEISRIARCIIVTDVPSGRGIKAEKLARVAEEFLKEVEIIEDIREAFYRVESLLVPICITGSLYLIGAVKSFIM
jgi:dihydrofolate synthase/folylpolyglutamate synthase